MAKSKKSKILAMALCASVMTGIYASPVMAAKLYVDTSGKQWVTTKESLGTIITELEGLKEITLGDSVKIIAGGGGIIRVGNAGGVNTRVHDDGFYVNTSGDDRKTSLKAGTLTLAGEDLTFKQLANINTVIGENGVITAANGSTVGGVRMNAGRVSGNGFFVRGSDNALDTTGLKLGVEYLDETKLGTINGVITDEGAVVSKGDVTSTDGTNTYHLNTVGKNTSGITIDSEGKVTTIEGAFSVDKKGYIYNANRSFQVTKDGAARFGNKYDDHIRMDDGVLSVKTDQNTIVARVSKDGFYVYKDNGTTVAGSLTKNGLTADSINVGGENFTVAHNGSVKAADERFIIDADGKVTATEFTAGGYNLTDIGKKTAGIRRTQSGATNVTVIEENLKVYDDGTIVGAKENFKVTADGTVISDKLNVGNGNFTVTDEGIGAFGSQFTVNRNGEISTTGINVAEGMFTASAGGVTMAENKLSVDRNGNIKAGTYNGVKIGMTGEGDITLGDDIIIDDKFNSGNVAGITRKPLKDSALGNTTYIEENTAISADGIVVTDPVSGVSTKTKYDGFYVKDKDSNIVSSLKDDGLMLTDPGSGVSTKTKYDGFYVKDKYSNIVSSLKDDGLMLTDQESGETHTLNATDIADIKGISRSGNDTDGKTTIEVATSFTKDGMVTSNITTNNITTGSFTAGVTEDSSYGIDANGKMLFKSGANYIGMDRGRIGFTSGTESVTINGEGTTFTSRDSTTRTTTSTVIKGGTITTDTLKVENIVLGNSMTDEVGNSIALGANGTLKVNNEKYSLNLDKTGFNLSNASNTSSFSLGNDGFAFAGPVNLGAASDVKFNYTGNLGGYTESSYSLSQLVDTVNDIYDRTSGIYKDAYGNTVVTDGTWNAESKEMEEANSSITVGENGATFESTNNEGATNINGGAIKADSSSIGNDVSGGSGSGSSGSASSGTYTDGSVHTGYFEDGDNSYEFTNDADGFTGTVTDGKHTTTIKNGAMGSNTTVEGDNASASSGVGIGNDGAFISDSVTNGDISHTVDGGSITDTVTNGDMTVTEVKDKNGSATTVKDANGSSTVSQDTKGQTVSTGTGTSVNTGNDFGVTDNETGKSIYMSDIGHVEDIDSEIQNSDGSKTTVVDAVNNEAEIRRNEIERVDGRINNLENRVGKLEDRIDKVGAMAAAIANLRTMGYDPAAPTEVAVGIGQYRDETGAALGLFHYPNRDFMLSLSVSTSGDEVMGGIGATWKFGRKSPEKVAEIKKAQAEADARRAEEAKLAKAEEMKQAAKEAKIKAQQERHAKLAAQAEAAK